MDIATLILTCSLYNDPGLIQAMIATQSQGQANVITRFTPGSASERQSFPSAQEAAQFAVQAAANKQSFAVGLMQIPSIWLTAYSSDFTDVLKPCRNLVIGTQILSQTVYECQRQGAKDPVACGLSNFYQGDSESGLAIAAIVSDYAQTHPYTLKQAGATAKHVPVAKVAQNPSSQSFGSE